MLQRTVEVFTRGTLTRQALKCLPSITGSLARRRCLSARKAEKDEWATAKIGKTAARAAC